MQKNIIILLVSIGLCFTFCKKKNPTEPEEPVESFDKQGLLQNYADNLILPQYAEFSNALDSLIESYNTFKNTGNSANFIKVKQQFQVAYLKYQYISIFEFGPAEQELVRNNFNVFPTDSVQIKSNINSGTYDLQSASNLDAKGFPALDYLFYDLNKTEAQVISSFNASTNKKQYVSDLLTEMRNKTSIIINTWNTSYKNQFTNSLSTDIGSSIGYLVNQLNYELDYLKNSKIGIPLGKKSLDIAIPEKCELFYSKQSVANALATLKSIENAYLGRGNNGIDGKGFDDYLDHLNASYGSTTLNSAIKSQFSITQTKLSAIAGSIDSEVIANPNSVNAAYNELVKLLVLLKTDLPSNLGVVITYQDGDGD